MPRYCIAGEKAEAQISYLAEVLLANKWQYLGVSDNRL